MLNLRGNSKFRMFCKSFKFLYGFM